MWKAINGSARRVYPRLAPYFFGTFILGLLSASVYVGRDVPFKEQHALYSMLQNVSGIMFAVFGLWIGLLYPDIRRRVFSVDHSPDAGNSTSNERHDSDDDTQANEILQPFFVSLSILLITIAVYVLAPLGGRLSISVTLEEWLRGISYGLIVLLAVLQITTVLQSIRITDRLKATISRGTSERHIKRRRHQHRNDRN